MTETANEYRIDLDNFAGPMDLLLHLIRKEEVDVQDIPIGNILDQYMEYVEVLKTVNLDEAGDFLVMATTLMVIKSKLLLPVDVVDLAEELDPRYELVQQLLEYKRIKENSQLLEQRSVDQAHRVGRPESARAEPLLEEDKSIDDIQVWDLYKQFNRILKETVVNPDADRVIRGHERPVREYASDIEGRLKAAPCRFRELLGECTNHGDRIGVFLAILLLVKTQLVQMTTVAGEDDIVLSFDYEHVTQHEQELDLEDDFRA